MTRSAGIVSIAVVISRVLGLIRDMVLVHLFDRSVLDSFHAAFKIPNLLRDLFGEGVLRKAFVTTFTDVEARSGEKEAWRLANLVFNALIILLAVITLIGILIAPFIVNLMLSGAGFDAQLSSGSNFGISDKRELTTYLTRIMFPFLIVISLAAISTGLLNSKGKFAIPASASSFFNIGSILIGVSGYYIAPRIGQHPIVGMAVGTLVGGALQFIVQTPSMWKLGFRYRPILSLTDPGVKQIMKLMAPEVVGIAALQINVSFNSYFASQGNGWMMWNQAAFRLMYVPIGALGVAISTATLPLLSWQTGPQKSMDDYKKTFSYALKLVFIVVLPASALLMVLNKPIIFLLFQHGRFTADDTIQVAGALFFYSFCLCGYTGMMITRDGFIAIKDMRTPVIVRLFAIALNIFLNYIMIFQLRFDHRSIAIATSCSTTVNFLILLGLLRRRVGGFGGFGLALVFLKALLSSAAMGVVGMLIYTQLLSVLGGELTFFIAIIALFIATSAAVLVFYMFCRILKLREVNQVIEAMVGKIRR